MISKGVKVKWAIGTEFLNIDFDALSESTQLTETVETRNGSAEVAVYCVKTIIEKTSENEFKLTIKYEKSSNIELTGNDYLWGTSILYIDKNSKKGRAEWKGEYFDVYDNEREWVRINLGLSKKIRKKKIITIVRNNQQRLRNALLEIDKVCLISGESLKNTLDVAHIISSSAGGNELLDNSVLMRADIHRLFDADYFELSSDGKVKILKKSSDYYENLLRYAKVPQNILNRIKDALKCKSS